MLGARSPDGVNAMLTLQASSSDLVSKRLPREKPVCLCGTNRVVDRGFPALLAGPAYLLGMTLSSLTTRLLGIRPRSLISPIPLTIA